MEDVLHEKEELVIRIDNGSKNIDWILYKAMVERLFDLSKLLVHASINKVSKRSVHVNPILVQSGNGQEIIMHLEEIKFGERARIESNFNIFSEFIKGADIREHLKWKINTANAVTVDSEIYDFVNLFSSLLQDDIRIEVDKRETEDFVVENKKTKNLPKIATPSHYYGGDVFIKPDLYNKEKVLMVTTVNSIKFLNSEYKFSTPLLIEGGVEDNIYLLESKILDIYASGKTYEDAFESFSEDLDFLYNRLMELPDDKLGKTMLAAKTYLKINCKKI